MEKKRVQLFHLELPSRLLLFPDPALDSGEIPPFNEHHLGPGSAVAFKAEHFQEMMILEYHHVVFPYLLFLMKRIGIKTLGIILESNVSGL